MHVSQLQSRSSFGRSFSIEASEQISARSVCVRSLSRRSSKSRSYTMHAVEGHSSARRHLQQFHGMGIPIKKVSLLTHFFRQASGFLFFAGAAPACPFAQPAHHRLFPSTGSPKLACFSLQPSASLSDFSQPSASCSSCPPPPRAPSRSPRTTATTRVVAVRVPSLSSR